ncbi:hypothetical protein ACYSNV_01540 [Myroides sp. LJL119]
MFTFVFQGVHTLEHMFSVHDFEDQHSSHYHFTQSRESASTLQFIEDHGSLEHCYVCDHMIAPSILCDITQIDSIEFFNVFKKQAYVALGFKKFSQIYFSLRAPPAIG